MQLHETKLNQVIETSIPKTSDPYWLNAIEKAQQQLIQNSYEFAQAPARQRRPAPRLGDVPVKQLDLF
jgi:hypothetical protein